MFSRKKQAKGRLLILGSHWELAGLVKKAGEQGLYVVVCDARPDGLARKYADMDYVADVRDISAITSICRRENIDHIMTSFSDLMFECMTKAADAAGLPCYAVPSMLSAYRNKQKTKEICRKLGIRVPSFVRLGRDFSESDISSAGISFPALMKPVDSYGSRGMHIVRSAGEIREFFEDSAGFSGDGTALVEEWTSGQEINIHGFVADGELTVVSAADRKTSFWKQDTIPALYGIVYPAKDAEAVIPKASALLSRYIRETGQKWGPIAMQCFWDGQEITVCEIAGRMLGFEHELIDMTTGLDTEQLLLDLCYDRTRYCKCLLSFRRIIKDRIIKRRNPGLPAEKGSIAEADPLKSKSECTTEKDEMPPAKCASLGLTPVSHWNTRHCAEGLYIQHIRGGIVADMREIRNITSFAMVAECTFFYEEGEKIGVLGPKQYFARVYTQADTIQDLLAAEEKVFEYCHVRNENGEEMLHIPSAAG